MALLPKVKKQKKKNKQNKVIDPVERERLRRERAFINQNRSIFISSGFEAVPGVDKCHFDFGGVRSELDDIFIYENVIIFVEYTTSSSANLGGHAKGKSGSHNKITADPSGFLSKLCELSPRASARLAKIPYTEKQRIYCAVYCSDPSVDDSHQNFFERTKFISRSERVYFKKLTGTLRRSARYELFDFLGVDTAKVGSGGIVGGGGSIGRYHGSLLPEEHSNFPSGFRVVSFYVDPDSLLRRSYVLRQGGWRDSLNLYQRMIIPAKINAIRKYLRDQHRVFANNVVITLPDDTEIRDQAEGVIDPNSISETTPAWIYLKDRPNSVGIVDGQHRVFSYYEDIEPDALIDKFRKQQNLLATGIIYPPGTSKMAKEKFEASLFLEINSNQSGAKSELKQTIWLLLDPFRPVSVARMVVNKLANSAPLGGILQKSEYDIDRIKTTTIVVYGIQPLVKRSGSDSLYSIWSDPNKTDIVDGNKDIDALERYIDFCAAHIGDFLTLVRNSLDQNRWKLAKAGGDGIISVTTINSFIILMRKLIEDGNLTETDLKVKLDPLNSIDYGKYRSSQYAALAARMHKAVLQGKP